MTVARWLAPADSVSDVDRVADEIRRGVVRCRWAPGSELSPRALRAEYAATVQVLDAALSRLVSEGVLVRRGGSVVAPALDRRELQRVHQLRREFEPELGAEALRGISRCEAVRMRRQQASAAQIEAYRHGSPKVLRRTFEHMNDLSEALAELAPQHDFLDAPGAGTAQIIEPKRVRS